MESWKKKRFSSREDTAKKLERDLSFGVSMGAVWKETRKGFRVKLERDLRFGV